MRPNQNSREWWITLWLLLIGICVVIFIFLTPDAGRQTHTSFFKVAYEAHWSWHSNWAAVWCSVKIILLGFGLFLLVDALGNLAIRMGKETAGLAAC